ncbi:hypothetical protein [Nitrosomonas sp. JL21]|nr:hypothetical protein [Nitrosomonas sp. JL21]
MIGFHMLSAGLKTMIHGGLQAYLMTMVTRAYTSLDIVFVVG